MDLARKVDGIMTWGVGVDCKQDDYVASIGQLWSSLDAMISMTKHLTEKIVQCILVVGGIDIARNEVA